MQKCFIQFIFSILRYSRFLGPMNWTAKWFFDHVNQKSINQFLAFLNLYQHAKNQFIPSVNSWNTVNFGSLWPDWPNPFLTVPTPKTFYFCEFHSNWVNIRLLHQFALEIVDLKILQWLAGSILAHISGTRFFQNLTFMQGHDK